ncbi:MAG TPA: aspartyl/asparaginyl beta-hydroxylase domain-containing protein [Verrucomicrobiae bacterium]|nr:aspartyl/asparaginyl beta-hydroxylase domain-containing protein [Verrucomicrobiae bacterium]
MKIKDLIFILVLGLFLSIGWVVHVPFLRVLSVLALFYLVCGLVDFQRSRRFEIQNWRRYFYGNGILTWLLSPFNLVMDVFCYKNYGVYKLENLPEDCQAEIRQMIKTATTKPEIITELSRRMTEKKRGMIFFKWYGKNIDNSLSIPEFHQQFKYIKTIGVSIFNKTQKTSIHYGPLRITLRVLYNLVPLVNDGVYIQAANEKHLWHENPLFIFDDTLVHQSVNGSDQLRYCMFVDIMRPSRAHGLLTAMLNVVKTSIASFNRIFYGNWDMIK